MPVLIRIGHKRLLGAFTRLFSGGVQPIGSINNSLVVVGSHPRVWMTPARIAHLVDQKNANAVRWTRVKSRADTQVAKGVAYVTSDFNTLNSLGLAYLATSNPDYATRADVILSNYCTESNLLQSDSALPYKFGIPNIVAGLDWCYAGLTVATRQQAASWLMNRADWVWPQTNPPRSSGWSVNDPANNYWWGFMQTGPAALAAAGDDLGSNKIANAVSDPDRPAYHRNLVYVTKWNQANTFFNSYSGGAWIEGTNYESTWSMGRVIDAIYTAENSTIGEHQFVKDSLAWRPYSVSPRWNRQIYNGDQPRSSSASVFSYDRPRIHKLIDASGVGSTERQLAQLWLNNIGQVPTSEVGDTGVLADELLHFNPNAVAATDFTSIPLSKVVDITAPNVGILSDRLSWTDADTSWLTAEAGNISAGHRLRNQGSIMFWKGANWILTHANYWSHSGIEQHTAYSNMFTYGASPQSQTSPAVQLNRDATWYWADLLPTYTSFCYDVGNCFVNIATNSGFPVTTAMRKVFWDKGTDVVVVFDRQTLVTAAQNKYWFWQAKSDPTTDLSDPTWVIKTTSNDYKCFGNLVFPTSDRSLSIDTLNLGSGGAQSSYRIRTTLTDTNATNYVVHVLQITANAVSSPPYSVSARLSDVSGTHKGVEVGAIGYWAGDVETPRSTLTYESVATTHMISDLTPSTSFTVTQQPEGGGAAETTYNFTSTSGGTGRFVSTNVAIKRFVLS
jgi:hypothetical protein